MRAFAGLASAPTVDARVDLVMEDLERLGAFERSVLCVASPTGSGYVNYVAVEALEYLTRGDCATVALQYSLRPSFLSLDRVAMGREQNRALFHALSWRLRALPEDRRPRLVGFGESLGAHTIQDAFLYEGAAGLHRVGMDRALFLGTPAGSKWAKDVAAGPRAHRRRRTRSSRSGRTRSCAALPRGPRRPAPGTSCCPTTRTRSPGSSPRWRCSSRPGWARPTTRPTGVPRHARWYPIATFFLTLIDTKNAMDVVPGTFVARGHDYRADLARMVSVAYGLPVDEDELLRIERALRRREADWARAPAGRRAAAACPRGGPARGVDVGNVGKEPARGTTTRRCPVRLTPSVRPALSARGRTAARASRGRWSPSAVPSRRTRCR